MTETDNTTAPAETPPDAKQMTNEVLMRWASFITADPQEVIDKLTREQLEDVFSAFSQEMDAIASFVGERQAKTDYPDRVYCRVLMQLGESQDQQITKLIEESQKEVEDGSE